jgi:hypothetical protein
MARIHYEVNPEGARPRDGPRFCVRLPAQLVDHVGRDFTQSGFRHWPRLPRPWSRDKPDEERVSRTHSPRRRARRGRHRHGGVHRLFDGCAHRFLEVVLDPPQRMTRAVLGGTAPRAINSAGAIAHALRIGADRRSVARTFYRFASSRQSTTCGPGRARRKPDATSRLRDPTRS